MLLDLMPRFKKNIYFQPTRSIHASHKYNNMFVINNKPNTLFCVQ